MPLNSFPKVGMEKCLGLALRKGKATGQVKPTETQDRLRWRGMDIRMANLPHAAIVPLVGKEILN